MTKEIRNEVTCKYCGYTWTPKVEKPKACVFCKSYKWDVGPETNEQEAANAKNDD